MTQCQGMHTQIKQRTEDSRHTLDVGVYQTRSPSGKGGHERPRRLSGTPWRERGTAGQTGAGHGGHGGCRCADNSTGCTLGWGQHCTQSALPASCAGPQQGCVQNIFIIALLL